LYFNNFFAQNNTDKILGGVILKGKIIDYDYFEASIALEDDTIIKVPFTRVSDYLGIGSTVSINTSELNYSTSNRPKIYHNNVTDFI
jgi:hypothetical protein